MRDSLDLNPSSIHSRLARSTCCQRPNRGPPERRVSVEFGNRANAIACPRNLLHLPARSHDGENLTNLARAVAACQRYEPCKTSTGAATPSFGGAHIALKCVLDRNDSAETNICYTKDLLRFVRGGSPVTYFSLNPSGLSGFTQKPVPELRSADSILGPFGG